MSYSEEFRAPVVERILSGEISLKEATRTYKLATQTDRSWRDKAIADNSYLGADCSFDFFLAKHFWLKILKLLGAKPKAIIALKG